MLETLETRQKSIKSDGIAFIRNFFSTTEIQDLKNKIEKWLYENGESPFQIQALPATTEECVSSDKKAA